VEFPEIGADDPGLDALQRHLVAHRLAHLATQAGHLATQGVQLRTQPAIQLAVQHRLEHTLELTTGRRLVAQLQRSGRDGWHHARRGNHGGPARVETQPAEHQPPSAEDHPNANGLGVLTEDDKQHGGDAQPQGQENAEPP
jgi:hypothetical protein